MINTATIMGRLTADPVLKTTSTGVPVTSFTVALDRAYKKDETDFIDVVAWRGTAEFICNHFKKGKMIALTGSIQTRTYDDKTGFKRKATEIVADQVSFCGDGAKADVTVPYNEPEDLPWG